MHFLGQRQKSRAHARRVSQNPCRCDRKLLPRSQRDRAATGKRARADFRSLQVRQHRDRFPELIGRSAQRLNTREMF